MLKTTPTALALSATACFALSANAAEFSITEIFTGVPGSDPTEDWVEITNTGTTAGSTAGLFVDDESALAQLGNEMLEITLQPGESLIMLMNLGGDDPDEAIDEFLDFWNLPANTAVGTAEDGGLSGSGDSAAIVTSAGLLVDSLTYSTEGEGTGTILPDLSLTNASTPGVLLSDVFNNPDLFGGDGQLFGTPNPVVIPEPTSLALFAAALGLTAARRRRRG